MRTALYSQIEPAANRSVAWVITEAQRRCGITLVQFDGWTNNDLRQPDHSDPLGFGTIHGPAVDQAQANRKLLNEIVDLLTESDGDCPTFSQTVSDEPETQPVLWLNV
jgi:hypothetical protein